MEWKFERKKDTIKTQVFTVNRDHNSHSLIFNFDNIPQGTALEEQPKISVSRDSQPFSFPFRAAVSIHLKRLKTQILPHSPVQMDKKTPSCFPCSCSNKKRSRQCHKGKGKCSLHGHNSSKIPPGLLLWCYTDIQRHHQKHLARSVQQTPLMFCMLFLNIAFSLPQGLFKCTVLFPNFDHLHKNSIQLLLSNIPLLPFHTRTPLLLFSCSPTISPRNVTDSQYYWWIHKGQMADVTENSKKQNHPVQRIASIPKDKFLCQIYYQNNFNCVKNSNEKITKKLKLLTKLPL